MSSDESDPDMNVPLIRVKKLISGKQLYQLNLISHPVCWSHSQSRKTMLILFKVLAEVAASVRARCQILTTAHVDDDSALESDYNPVNDNNTYSTDSDVPIEKTSQTQEDDSWQFGIKKKTYFEKPFTQRHHDKMQNCPSYTTDKD